VRAVLRLMIVSIIAVRTIGCTCGNGDGVAAVRDGAAGAMERGGDRGNAGGAGGAGGSRGMRDGGSDGGVWDSDQESAVSQESAETDADADAGADAGGGGCGDLVVRRPYDETLFKTLTTHQWRNPTCGSYDQMPLTCITIELRADGTYRWSIVSDIVERDESGIWNFSARDERSGIVLLSGGSVIAFELNNGQLTFGQYDLAEGDELDPSTVTSGGRTGLPEVRVPELYCELLDGPWSKTNQADLYCFPDRYEFHGDGTMVASFREGECTHTSTWSLDGFTTIEREAPNMCDKRRSEPAADVFVGSVSIEGDMLLFNSLDGYRRGTESSVDQLFIVESYSRTVELRAELRGPLVAGEEIEVDLTMTNTSLSEENLQNLTISMHALQLIDNDFNTVGEEAVLTVLDLTGIVLAPEEQQVAQVSIIPEFAGTYIDLQFALAFSDEWHEYVSRRAFIVLAPDPNAF
jgi:hypothetical protein